MSLEDNLAERLLAAAVAGGPAALDRVIEVWGEHRGSRAGLTDALLDLERRGRVQLDAVRDGDRVDIRGISAASVVDRPAATAHPEEVTRLEPLVRDSRAVFVIHGRDARLRASLFDFLRALDLRPIEWSELVSGLGTGVPYVGQLLDRAFDMAQAVVVLMSPDEQVQLREGLAEGNPEVGQQARPNVIFEAGMALGRSPSRTIIVEVGSIRPFSDIAGRHVIRLNEKNPTASIASRQDLAQRLRTLGCPVQLGGTDWHTAGTFRPTKH